MAVTPKQWTLEELNRLPDDGNKYELVRGELFVTPAPTFGHEALVSVLHRILEPYVVAQQLGLVFRPRAVLRIGGSEVEPDLMVRPFGLPLPRRWEDAPLPILVVETLSENTGRRDQEQKRDLYVDEGIPAYWIVDGDRRCIRVVRPGYGDDVTDTTLVWHPAGATEPLVIDVGAYFRDALG